ncbi:hypothetical protein [Helicobacter sp. 11S03491-1]|nr:hypothetical protein [Helicobacter sp. 11S03491-1]
MEWIQTIGNIALIIFLVITFFKISNIEKRIRKLEDKIDKKESHE